jgi:hypothetical protein
MSVHRVPRSAPAVGSVEWRNSVPLISSLAFVTVMLGMATHASNAPIVVYALSFWHYEIYALAFLYRAVDLTVFKRDAVITRTISLIAFGWVYFAEPLSSPSLVVVGLGFLLNAAAVRALGADRTYYGRELNDLPPKRIVEFPYSWMPHPMLIGNIAAFGGALLNDDFRLHWWPLAVAHAFFNFAIILMEAHVRPERRIRREGDDPPIQAAELLLRCSLWGAAGGLAGVALALSSGQTNHGAAAIAGACSAAYACALFESYMTPKGNGLRRLHEDDVAMRPLDAARR